MGSGFSTLSVMVPDPIAGIKPIRPTADRDGQPYPLPTTPSLFPTSYSLTPNP
jgi:hypothetical protein